MNCAVCGEPVTQSPVIAFHDWHGGYPTQRIGTGMSYCHDGCAESDWYVIGGDFSVEGRRSWMLHLAAKRWFNPAFMLRIPDLCHEALTVMSLRQIQDQGSPGAVAGARDIGAGLRARILERDRFCCRRCGCGPETRELVVDHIIPVAKGGDRHAENLQTLCVLCNAGKMARNPTPHDLAAAQSGRSA